jgi:hypothetical protein
MLRYVDQFWKAIWGILISTLLAWLTFGSFVVALAEELPVTNNPSSAPPEKVSPRRSELDPSNIPSEKVSQFVRACLQVVALIDRREGELQGAETESESVRIEQEIEAEALAIIEQAGLTRQEYLQLLGLANTDPEFGERIAIQLQEATT